METPNSWAGKTTEKIMGRVRSTYEGRGLSPLQTREYNAIYECVFEVLFREVGGDDPTKKEPRP